MKRQRLYFPLTGYKIWFILLFLDISLLFSIPPGTSSFEFLQQQSWNGEKGLPCYAFTMAQTLDGFLWIGCETGLARFDGVTFQFFNQRNAPQLKNNYILDLEVDNRGGLWIGTFDGVYIYRDGAFSAFGPLSGQQKKGVRALLHAQDQSMWIGSWTGVNHFVKGQLHQVPLPAPTSRLHVTALCEYRLGGGVWAGTRELGLFRVNRWQERFESDYIALKGKEIGCLLEDLQGNLWIGTRENGLFYLEKKRNTPKPFRMDIFSGVMVSCLHQDQLGNVWIGAFGKGIFIYLREENRLIRLQDLVKLPSPAINCIFRDREGTHWLSARGILCSLREAKIRNYTTRHGLSYNIIFGMFQDSRGRVWTGTRGHGANYFENNRFHTLTKADGLSSDSVVSFAQDASGAIWLGTLGQGINRWQEGKIDVFSAGEGLSHSRFYAVYVDPRDRILAGSEKGGIFLFKEGKFHLIANIKKRINTFMTDSRGNLWIGTYNGGICRLDLKTGTFRFLDSRHGVVHPIISSFYEDQQGIIWIGTDGGINRYKNGNMDALTTCHGLPDNVAYFITEDHRQNIWVSCDVGIYCLERLELDAFFSGLVSRLHPVIYDKDAGLGEVECNGANHPPGWKARDGRLWFPTVHGAAVVDPKNLGINKIPPPVVIQKLVVDGTPVPISKPGTVTLPPGCKQLEFQFTGLSFVAPHKMRFRCRLGEYETHWRDLGNVRKALYTNLPPGRFRFRVTACNSDCIWNHDGAYVDLYIEAYFYQTLLFKIIATSLALLLGITIYIAFRTGKIRKLRSWLGHNPMTLTSKDRKESLLKLQYLMNVEKIYRDPGLTIKVLAGKMEISPRNLSLLLNHQLQTNFSDFIASHRVKEAKSLLADPGNRKTTILEIARQVGYNSKNPFNRTFKKMTGVTPSQFRKKNNGLRKRPKS